MAPDVRRWLIAAALSSAAIAVAYLPPVPRERDYRDYPGFGGESPERNREQRVRLALKGASERLTRAERTELLLSRAKDAGARPARSPDLLVRGSIEPRAESAIRASFDTLMSDLGPMSTDVRLVGVIDATTGGPILMAFPSATGGKTCGVLFSAGVYAEAAQAKWVRPWLSNGVSRCAYYAAFGFPGPAIQEWLTRRSFDVAAMFPWRGDTTEAPLSPNPPWMIPLLYYTIGYPSHPDVVGCARGEPGHCLARILEPGEPEPFYLRTSMEGGVMSAGMGANRTAARNYLADLLREMGPERFGRFWKSPLPVEGAFAAAFGTDLVTWTSRWQIKELRVVPQRTAVKPGVVLEGILVILVAFAVVAVFAERREVA